jgi:hypothetical protein
MSYTEARLIAALVAIANTTKSIVRPSGHPDISRALLDIEQIAIVAIAEAKAETAAAPAKG